MKLKLWGTRGSIPTPDRENMQYGGNTTCLEIESNKGDHYIVDAGTGLRKLGLDLMARHKGKPFDAKLFVTHVHWDHIQGFPFFVPGYVPGMDLTVYSGKKKNKFKGALEVKDTFTKATRKVEKEGRLTEYLFDMQQSKYVFPISTSEMLSKPRFADLADGEEVHNGVVASYKNFEFVHPDEMASYKFTEGEKTFIVQSDFEHNAILPKELRGAKIKENEETAKIEEEVLKWWNGANAVYYDAMYLPEEYDPEAHGAKGMSKKTWGHSTYEKGIDLALAAGVKHLILGHHEPNHDDEALDTLEARALLYKDDKVNGRNLKISMAKEGAEYIF